jgi:hypothetical protein
MTDHRENCVRDCWGVMRTFACSEEPTNISSAHWDLHSHSHGYPWVGCYQTSKGVPKTPRK